MIQDVMKHLAAAESILFITGAGLSADSGLPTYRGIGGLYAGQNTPDGIPVETALAGDMLKTRPEITWKYLSQIETNCRGAKFNDGHLVIAQMENHFPRVWTLTQNIDGFHTQAGSSKVIEIHGNLHRLRCEHCAWQTTIHDFSDITIPPLCGQCRAEARPDVVFFGEALPLREAQLYEQELRTGFDIYVWVGTTAVFPYIQYPLAVARAQGGITIEINPGETEISDQVDYKIAMGAAKALRQIWPHG